MTLSTPINLQSPKVAPDGVGPTPAAREEISA
jgi:hypothetical protein